ncbi:MAG: tRNA (guanine-N1)-methyltransferase [Archaeoglobaceae archaeon]
MRLVDLFVQILREKGVRGIGVSSKQHCSLQRIALLVANGKYSLCTCGSYKYIVPVSENVADVCLAKCEGIISKKDIVERDSFPYIAIDCRFYDLHSEKEKFSLEVQVKQVLGVVRKYLWDDKLIVASHDFGVGRYYERLEDFLTERGIGEVLLLDPYAEKAFRGETSECYVLGGIVDKGEEKVLTPKIGEELEKSGFKVVSRRIELRGSVVGVPDRLNHIAEIVLRVVCDGEDVERAIKSVQPPVVAKWRLRIELPKKSFRIRVGSDVARGIFKSVFRDFDWLNVRESDFYEVASQLKFFVLDDGIAEKLVWDEERKCYQLRSS